MGPTCYKIAGIDVHKEDAGSRCTRRGSRGEYQLERRIFGSSPDQLRSLAARLLKQEGEEAVMESTAQYWKPVWEALERYWKPLRQKGRRKPEVRDVASGAGPIQSRGFPRPPNAR